MATAMAMAGIRGEARRSSAVNSTMAMPRLMPAQCLQPEYLMACKQGQEQPGAGGLSHDDDSRAIVASDQVEVEATDRAEWMHTKA